MNKEAYDFVISRLIAGETDEEVRAALIKAGYQGDVSRTTLWRYRQLPVVTEAAEQMWQEAVRTGFSLRHRRVNAIGRKIAQFERQIDLRLAAADALLDNEGKLTATAIQPFDPAINAQKLHDAFLKSIAALSALVDPPQPPASGKVAGGPGGMPTDDEEEKAAPAKSRTIDLALYNDMAEWLANRLEEQAAIDAQEEQALEPERAREEAPLS
jgi:hypothetical protein